MEAFVGVHKQRTLCTILAMMKLSYFVVVVVVVDLIVVVSVSVSVCVCVCFEIVAKMEFRRIV